MPNDKQHISHTQHNIDFLQTFSKIKCYRDWLITVCFYISVHIVESAIFKSKELTIYGNKFSDIKDSDDVKRKLVEIGKMDAKGQLSPHEARKLIVNYNFIAIRNEYGILYNKSKTARYHRYSFDDNDITLVLQRCLKKIIEWSNKELATSYDTKDIFL